MNKVILVIDMPRSCNECSLMCEDEYSYYCPVRLHENITDLYRDYIITSEKPEWCPLKELPKKLEGNDSIYYQWGDYEDGWNHCIDFLIEGSIYG